MTTPFLGIGASLSPPKFLLQRKFAFPPLLPKARQPLSFIQRVNLSRSEPLNISLVNFPTSVNNLVMRESVELPSTEFETPQVTDEIKDKTYYQQVYFSDRIDTNTVNQSSELPVSKPTLSKANKKQAKSKTSKKQSKSKKGVKDTTVTQKVYQSFGQISSISNTNGDNKSYEASVSLDTTANLESFIGGRTQS
ncbi:hypothetical protein, partial [Scytonema sp. PRP1]|uniref:hypothetical protein n=1 Tax=Scytonema sp. PRP1 TaxID=3120513 RepID=UPI002FCEDE46